MIITPAGARGLTVADVNDLQYAHARFPRLEGRLVDVIARAITSVRT